jgi:hypothetical protein
MHNTLHRGVGSLVSLARAHDELPAFNAAYWVLTLLAAVLFNIGAFALLVAGHIALDVYKYREVHKAPWKDVIEGVFRENVLDVSLLFLGIAFSIYFHASLPILAGLRGILRTELSIVNAIVQVTVKAHILHNILMLLLHVYQYLEVMHPRIGKRTSLLENVAIASLLISLTLIMLSPWILHFNAAEGLRLAEEMLIPWNM